MRAMATVWTWVSEWALGVSEDAASDSKTGVADAAPTTSQEDIMQADYSYDGVGVYEVDDDGLARTGMCDEELVYELMHACIYAEPKWVACGHKPFAYVEVVGELPDHVFENVIFAQGCGGMCWKYEQRTVCRAEDCPFTKTPAPSGCVYDGAYGCLAPKGVDRECVAGGCAWTYPDVSDEDIAEYAQTYNVSGSKEENVMVTIETGVFIGECVGLLASDLLSAIHAVGLPSSYTYERESSWHGIDRSWDHRVGTQLPVDGDTHHCLSDEQSAYHIERHGRDAWVRRIGSTWVEYASKCNHCLDGADISCEHAAYCG